MMRDVMGVSPWCGSLLILRAHSNPDHTLARACPNPAWQIGTAVFAKDQTGQAVPGREVEPSLGPAFALPEEPEACSDDWARFCLEQRPIKDDFRAGAGALCRGQYLRGIGNFQLVGIGCLARNMA